jgi:multiple sugar transport system substrate-binding protein
MKRRSARLLTLLGGVAILGAACAQSTPTASTVTVTFWHGYNPEETKVFNEKVVAAYQQAHPNIKIQAQAVPYDTFHKKLLTAIAGGQSPDVIRADIIWVPELADLGALVALDTAMTDFNTYSSKVFPGPLSTNQFKGHYYGLPLDTNTRVLLWNKAMYAQAGISSPPATVDEFTSDVAKMSNGKDKFGYAEGGTGGWNFLPWLWTFGGNVTDDSVTKASGYLNGPDSVAALTWFVNLYKSHQMGPSVLGGDPHTDVGYAKDVYANVLDGPWMVPIFKAVYPSKTVDLAPIPAGKGGSSSVVGGEDIVLFKESQHKAEAQEFIRFMLSRQTQVTMGNIGQMPVLSELAGSPDLPAFFAVFQQQLKTAKARTPSPAWPKIDDAIGTAVTLAIKGQATPQQALDQAANTIDGLLKGS